MDKGGCGCKGEGCRGERGDGVGLGMFVNTVSTSCLPPLLLLSLLLTPTLLLTPLPYRSLSSRCCLPRFNFFVFLTLPYFTPPCCTLNQFVQCFYSLPFTLYLLPAPPNPPCPSCNSLHPSFLLLLPPHSPSITAQATVGRATGVKADGGRKGREGG